MAFCSSSINQLLQSCCCDMLNEGQDERSRRDERDERDERDKRDKPDERDKQDKRDKGDLRQMLIWISRYVAFYNQLKICPLFVAA
jgi:hypothetical protein